MSPKRKNPLADQQNQFSEAFRKYQGLRRAKKSMEILLRKAKDEEKFRRYKETYDQICVPFRETVELLDELKRKYSFKINVDSFGKMRACFDSEVVMPSTGDAQDGQKSDLEIDDDSEKEKIYSKIGGEPKYKKIDLKICANEILIEAVKSINDLNENFIVMVTGERKMGKSTFCRSLMNKFLEKNLSVFYLECDPGQTEFTPPSCLALTEIVKRVDGLPFTHLRTPVSCKFFGETTPSNRTSDYLSCIRELVSDYRRISAEASPSCLVVNTSGWIQGPGLHALLEICREAKPNYTVLLCPPHQHGESISIAFDALRSTLTEVMKFLPAESSPLKCRMVQKDYFYWQGNLSPPELREAALLAYFGYQLSENGTNLESVKEQLSVNIRATTPYVVPMNRIYVNIVHGIPPPNYVLSILNASVVALCRYETDDLLIEHWLGDNSLPMVFKENISKIQCLGFGFIRAIDVENRSFYVVTPMPKEELVYVNTFLKGDVSLPSTVFVCQQPSPDDQFLQVPYVTTNRDDTPRISCNEFILKPLDEVTRPMKRKWLCSDGQEEGRRKKKRKMLDE